MFDDVYCICQEREMQEIEADLLSNKPDIVRLVHSNVRQPEPKYRTDENVLGRSWIINLHNSHPRPRLN